MVRLTDAAANRIKSVIANAGRPIVGPWRQLRVPRVDMPTSTQNWWTPIVLYLRRAHL